MSPLCCRVRLETFEVSETTRRSAMPGIFNSMAAALLTWKRYCVKTKIRHKYGTIVCRDCYIIEVIEFLKREKKGSFLSMVKFFVICRNIDMKILKLNYWKKYFFLNWIWNHIHGIMQTLKLTLEIFVGHFVSIQNWNFAV